MKKISSYIIALIIACSLFSSPKTIAWWNLIFPAEYTVESKDQEIKFFFIEWIKSIRACKK